MRSSRSLHAMAAVAIALATILNVISVQAQVGKNSSTADAKPPVVNVAPKKINFRKFHAGMMSPPRGVAFTNKSNADLAAPAVAVSGTGFSLFFNGCTTSLSAGGSCAVSVTFKPPSKGEFRGSLTFTDGGAKSPQKVKLDGIGLAAVPTSTATATATATATLTPTPTPTSLRNADNLPNSDAESTATPTITPTPKPAFEGYVMSGSKPVSGSSVKVWYRRNDRLWNGRVPRSTTSTSAADGSFYSGIFSCASYRPSICDREGRQCRWREQQRPDDDDVVARMRDYRFRRKNFLRQRGNDGWRRCTRWRSS